MVCRAQGSPEGMVPPREIEHLGRLPFKENESSSDRVVIEPESGRSDLSAMELSSNRSLCYSAEQEVSSVCVTCSRPGGICSGRSFNQLGRDVSVCVSSILQCLRKIQTEECLVWLIAPLWEAQPWFPLLLSLLVAPPIQLPVNRDLLYQPVSLMLHPTPGIFCLHAMQQQMEASGISRAVAQQIYSSKRSSTNNLYDYRWKSWVDWCFFVLRFYGPVNPMGSCRARSVYLTTPLLGRLSPLSG